jgi:peptide/nickel transport system permease protein
VTVLSRVTTDPFVDEGIAASDAGRHRAWRVLRRNPTFWIGTIGVALIVLAAILAPVLSSHDPYQQFRREGLTAGGDPIGPTAQFPLGTDKLGRDYLSRLLHGARTSLIVGIGANFLATVIGVFVGAGAAFAGSPRIRVRLGRGRTVDVSLPIETILMRATDAVLSFPALLLAIALVAVIGPSLGLVTFVIAAVLWAGVARIIYGRATVIRELDFITAARACGVGPARILLHHVMPQLFSLIVVYATLGIAGAVLFEATLSFLGVGVPPPTASWGGMIFEHIGYYKSDPRTVVLPGLGIMATILAFNLLGDALADALDPRLWR